MRKILSITLSLMVLLTMCAAPVWAAEKDAEGIEVQSQDVLITETGEDEEEVIVEEAAGEPEMAEEVAAPETPQITSCEAVSVCRAYLKWTPSEGAEGYEVTRTYNEEAVVVGDTDQTELKALGVHKKTPSYTVRAYKTVNGERIYSEYSEPVEIYTKAYIGQACKADPKHKLGNQTGTELRISAWVYTPKAKDRRHYTMMLRMKDPKKREKLAYTVEQACKGKYVGYSMIKKQRTTFYKQLKKAHWNIDKMHKRCATSCTRLACVGINATGVKFPYDIDAWKLRKAAKKHKKDIYIYYNKKYLTTWENLERGDILVDEKHHTVVVL